MTIKEQINNLVEGYKLDFYKQCGFHLIVIPQVGLPKIPLYEICNYCCDHLEIKVDILHTNQRTAIKAKQFITGLCIKMGYEEVEIYKALGLDRTSLYNTKRKFNSSMKNRTYKYEFYKFLGYLYEYIDKDFDRLSGNWHIKVDFYDSIFMDNPTTYIQKPPDFINYKKGKRRGASALLEYIKEHGDMNIAYVIDYAVKQNWYKSRASASRAVGNLVKEEQINKVGRIVSPV